MFETSEAVLAKAVSLDGRDYTKAVDALNAWTRSRQDGNIYFKWGQASSYPYFTDAAAEPAQSRDDYTSFGS